MRERARRSHVGAHGRCGAAGMLLQAAFSQPGPLARQLKAVLEVFLRNYPRHITSRL